LFLLRELLFGWCEMLLLRELLLMELLLRR